jgi:hypothetical protein
MGTSHDETRHLRVDMNKRHCRRGLQTAIHTYTVKLGTVSWASGEEERGRGRLKREKMYKEDDGIDWSL